MIKDVTSVRMKKAVDYRKKVHDKHKILRKFDIGQKVWCRIPGLTHKLEESWGGPYVITEQISEVNYRIRHCLGKRKAKVVHINSIKLYTEREDVVNRIMVVGSEEEDDGAVCLVDRSKEYVARDVKLIEVKFEDVLSEVPGKTEAVQMVIDVGEAKPIAQHPYRVPPRLTAGVQAELDRLLQANIIEPSNSRWASPMVPVVKPDGSVRY